jgi:hypothetical protein
MLSHICKPIPPFRPPNTAHDPASDSAVQPASHPPASLAAQAVLAQSTLARAVLVGNVAAVRHSTPVAAYKAPRTPAAHCPTLVVRWVR